MSQPSVFHVGGVFDPVRGEVTQPTAITVDDGHVLSVGDTKDKDGNDFRDFIALPGLIDGHTHLSIRTPGQEREQVARPLIERVLRARKYCTEMLSEGVTTIRGMGEPAWFDIELRDASLAGLLDGPRIVTSGKIIAPTHADVSIVDDPADGAQVVSRVRENLARGADWIKIYATPASGLGDPTESHYSEREIQMIVECAKRANTSVAAHAHGGDAVDYCIEFGVRTIEHGRFLSNDQLETMAQQDVALCSTVIINVEQDVRLTGCSRREALERTQQSIAEAIRTGVTIIPGSDAVHGSFRFELEALEFFGMDRLEALRAATIVAAEVLDLPESGCIAEGLFADFSLVHEDPLSSAEYPKVAATVVGGTIVWADETVCPPPSRS